MVIDSSVLLAIVLGEEDAERYVDALATGFEERKKMALPASVIMEAGIIAGNRGKGKELAALIEKIQANVVPLTEEIAHLSVKVFRKYGKGIHKAALNLGDCMSYATAEYLKEPLLYKGNDFTQTPILKVL
jgi:ribonuclease VapC